MGDRELKDANLEFRLEEHLSFEQVLAYLTSREQRRQIVRVGIRLISETVDEQRPNLRSHALVAVVGPFGAVRQSASALTPGESYEVPIGEGARLHLARELFTGAARLSLGPEVDGIAIEQGTVQILIYDVLEQLL